MNRPQAGAVAIQHHDLDRNTQKRPASKNSNGFKNTEDKFFDCEPGLAVQNDFRMANERSHTRNNASQNKCKKGFGQSGSENCLEAYFGSLGGQLDDEEVMRQAFNQRKRSPSGHRNDLATTEPHNKKRGRRLSARDQNLRQHCMYPKDTGIYHSRNQGESENRHQESLYNVRKQAQLRARGKENRPQRMQTEFAQRRSIKNGKSSDELSRNSRSGSRYQRGFPIGRSVRLGKAKVRNPYSGLNFNNVSGKNSKYSGVIGACGFAMGNGVKSIGGYQSHRASGKNFFEYNGSGQRKIRVETETALEKMPLSKKKALGQLDSKEKRQSSKGASLHGSRRDGLQSFFQNLELRNKKASRKGLRGSYGLKKNNPQIGYCGYGSETGNKRKTSKGSHKRNSVKQKRKSQQQTLKAKQSKGNQSDFQSTNNSLRRKPSQSNQNCLVARKNRSKHRPKNIPNFRDVKNLTGKSKKNPEQSKKNRKSSKHNSRRKAGSEILASLVGGTGRLLTSGGRSKWNGASRRKMSGILSQKERMFETIYKEKMRPDSKNNVGRRKVSKASNRWRDKTDTQRNEGYGSKAFAKTLQNQAPSMSHIYGREDDVSKKIESVKVMEPQVSKIGMAPKFTSLSHLQTESNNSKPIQNSWKGVPSTGNQAGKFNIPKKRGALRDQKLPKKNATKNVSTRDTKTRKEESENFENRSARKNEVKISSFFKGNNNLQNEAGGRIREETPDICSRTNQRPVLETENCIEIEGNEENVRNSIIDSEKSKISGNDSDNIEIEEEGENENQNEFSEEIEEEKAKPETEKIEDFKKCKKQAILGDITLGYQNFKNKSKNRPKDFVIGKENQQPNIMKNQQHKKNKLKPEILQNENTSTAIEIEGPNPSQNLALRERNRNPRDFQTIGNFKDILREHIDPIMHHLRSKDQKCRVQQDYFKKKQKQVDSKMREVLVDWLIEVHNRYKMRDETIFVAVRLVDKFLDLQEVEYHRFQLLGTACLMIAAKYEEIYPPKVKDFVYICANAYSREEVLDMESKVLRAMNFDLVFPTSIQFFGFFSKLWGFESVVKNLVHYILYGSLVQEAFVRTSPRLLAYSSVLMGYKAFKKTDRAKQFKLQFSGEFVESDVNYCIFQIYNMLLGLKKTELSALRSRFSAERYGNIAQIEARVH